MQRFSMSLKAVSLKFSLLGHPVKAPPQAITTGELALP